MNEAQEWDDIVLPRRQFDALLNSIALTLNHLDGRVEKNTRVSPLEWSCAICGGFAAELSALVHDDECVIGKVAHLADDLRARLREIDIAKRKMLIVTLPADDSSEWSGLGEL